MARLPLGSWRAALEEAKARAWKEAAAVLCQRIDVFPPAAAAALLLLHDNEEMKEAAQEQQGWFDPNDGIGFSRNDRVAAHDLCAKLRDGDTLYGVDAARCVRYARLHSEQAMRVAGTDRKALQGLFHGRDCASGQRLRMARHHGGADGDDRFSDTGSTSYDSGSSYSDALRSGKQRRTSRPADDASSTDASDSDEEDEEEEDEEEGEEDEAEASPRLTTGALKLVPASVVARDVAAARVDLLQEQYEAAAAAAAAAQEELQTARQELCRAQRRAAKDMARFAAEGDSDAADAGAPSGSERRRSQSQSKGDNDKARTSTPPEAAEREQTPAAAAGPPRRRLRRRSEPASEPCSDAAPRRCVRRKLALDTKADEDEDE